MLEKMFHFLNASFVAPKSSHRCDWEYQPKSKWKIHVQKDFLKYSHQIFYFLLFWIRFYISQSADIIFHKFLELYSLNIIWKLSSFIQHYHSYSTFFNRFTQAPPSPSWPNSAKHDAVWPLFSLVTELYSNTADSTKKYMIICNICVKCHTCMLSFD